MEVRNRRWLTRRACRYLRRFEGKEHLQRREHLGGATCTVTSNGMGAKLTCPANTTKVEVGALNSYSIKTSDWYDEFGAEYHVFCYSRPINIAK